MRQGNERSESQWTVLTHLCFSNPHLLAQSWALQLVESHGGAVDVNGWCALMWLLQSERAIHASFNSRAFLCLWELEYNITDVHGRSALVIARDR